MTLRRSQSQVRATPRARTDIILATVALSIGLLMTTGCGGGAGDVGTTDTTVGGAVTTAATTPSLAPSEMGDAIGAVWADAMQELTTLLADTPEPSAVRTLVEDLKEKYVQKLVDFGRRRASLDAGQKAEIDSSLISALGSYADAPWFVDYNTIYDAYAGGDQDFANLLASFNILTQYADFDLLKQQEPEEAARLGIE